MGFLSCVRSFDGNSMKFFPKIRKNFFFLLQYATKGAIMKIQHKQSQENKHEPDNRLHAMLPRCSHQNARSPCEDIDTTNHIFSA